MGRGFQNGDAAGYPCLCAKALSFWGALLLYPFFILEERSKKMKKITLLLLVLVLLVSAGLVSCNNEPLAVDPWENAIYKTDATIGSGEKTIQVEIRAWDKSITLTVLTDSETLGEALMSHGLISGEMGSYGLYVKSVNGIIADYDVDQTYWGIYQNGEYLMTGVDTTKISDGEHYELVREKG